MDLEVWTHIAVILFLVIDAAAHLWRHRWWRKEKRYTLNEARAILFAQVMADHMRDRVTAPKPDQPHFTYPTIGTEKDVREQRRTTEEEMFNEFGYPKRKMPTPGVEEWR